MARTPLSQSQTLPSINRSFDHPPVHRGSTDYQDSRRSSLDRMSVNQQMDKLALNTQSPYHSTNASQSSIVSGLQRERGIPTAQQGPRYGGLTSPLGPRSSGASHVATRIAPPIMENPRADIYNAPDPTRGKAYAFPDPDASSINGVGGRPPSNYSRRNSFAESFSSSIFTNDSRLPPGQQGEIYWTEVTLG